MATYLLNAFVSVILHFPSLYRVGIPVCLVATGFFLGLFVANTTGYAGGGEWKWALVCCSLAVLLWGMRALRRRAMNMSYNAFCGESIRFRYDN